MKVWSWGKRVKILTKVLSPQRQRLLLITLVIGLIIAATLLKIAAATPTWLHYDENYYLDVSQNFVLRGEITFHMWRLGGTNIIAGAGSGYGILALTLWMQAFGVSLWNGRLLMIIAGLLSALVLYFAARKWWNSPLAGWAAAIFAFVATSPFYSMTARMDAIGMLAYAIVLLLHAYALRGQSRWLHAAVGIAAVAAAEFHVLAIMYLGGLAFSYGISYLRLLYEERRIILDTPAVYFGIGAFIAGILYLIIHVLPDPRAYFIISEQCFDCSGRSLEKEINRFAGFFVLRLPELIILILSLGTALMRRRKEDHEFVLLVVGFLIAQAVISPPAFIHYTYHIWPLIALGCAGVIAHGFTLAEAGMRWRIAAGLLAAVGMLALNVVYAANNNQPFELRLDITPSPAAVYVRETFPTDTVVMADVTDYYALQNFPNFLSYRNGVEYGIALRGETILEFWQREQPLVILGDWQDDDAELAAYMELMDFARVEPGVWVAGVLRERGDS
jgi:4-amino-4-deoxy-L-arabinose transferase-like glycosyltransferase